VDPLGVLSSWCREQERHTWERWEANPEAKEIREQELPALPPPTLRWGDAAFPATLDLSRPFVVKGFLADVDLRNWSVEALQQEPVASLVVDYFRDARRFNTVTDARAPLRDIIANITRGGPEKIGTEAVFRRFPELLERSHVQDRLHQVFGSGWFEAERIGLLLTMPIFLAKGARLTDPMASSRTDLHSEPICNVALQVEGRRRWTLVDAEHSAAMRPSIAPDGRAYVMSRHHPASAALSRIPRYEFVLEAGDVAWIPAWTWHRVDYLEDEVALGVSFFHFRVGHFLRNSPLFAMAIVPNLFKELLGIKTK